MATSPATSMDLPGAAPEYATMDSEETQKVFKLAEDHGFSFLPPQEIAKLVPSFPG